MSLRSFASLYSHDHARRIEGRGRALEHELRTTGRVFCSRCGSQVIDMNPYQAPNLFLAVADAPGPFSILRSTGMESAFTNTAE